MLGENTNCDLSGETAKLDLSIMRAQTEKRFFGLITQINNKTSEIRDNSLMEENRRKHVSSMVSHGSKELERLAKDVAEVAELLHTLYNTEDREIKIV